MTVFIDTSAFYAVLCSDDPNHKRAKKVWTYLLNQREILVCNNYVLVETFALLQNRLGIDVIRAFEKDAIPWLKVEWINKSHHQDAVTSLLTAGRRNLSLVDCACFGTMHRQDIQTAFTFDAHFAEQSFECLP